MDLREQYNNYTPHTIGELWTASKTRDTVCDEFVEEAKKITLMIKQLLDVLSC